MFKKQFSLKKIYDLIQAISEGKQFTFPTINPGKNKSIENVS